jgi:hypothetical protein
MRPAMGFVQSKKWATWREKPAKGVLIGDEMQTHCYRVANASVNLRCGSSRIDPSLFQPSLLVPVFVPPTVPLLFVGAEGLSGELLEGAGDAVSVLRRRRVHL